MAVPLKIQVTEMNLDASISRISGAGGVRLMNRGVTRSALGGPKHTQKDVNGEFCQPIMRSSLCKEMISKICQLLGIAV